MATISYDFIWVAADGTITELTPVNGYTIERGVFGLDAPPVELFTQARTDGDGSVLVKRRTGVRSVALPMYVNTGGMIRTAISNMADVFRGPGILRVSDNGTTFRNLRSVYYETGLEGDESAGRSMPHAWRKVVVSLQALDPWWYGDAETVVLSFGTQTDFDDAATDFDDAATPFDGGDSTTFTVDGHADAYPVWTLEGPFTTCSISVAGQTAVSLSNALADGSTLTIDTRPGSRGPSLDGAGVDWSLLTADSRLPMLPAGTASVAVGVSGDDAGSSITVEYEPRWLTP